MGRAPTGTVTFMFTDIVGSTRHWQDDRTGMEHSLPTHDQILRDAIEGEGGYVFATGGDSFSAAFPTPHKALGAAISMVLKPVEEHSFSTSSTTGWTGSLLPYRKSSS